MVVSDISSQSTENRCLNPKWISELRCHDEDSDDEQDYALCDNQTNGQMNSSPIEFNSEMFSKIARKCPNLNTLSLVQCLMGRELKDT